MGLTSKIPEAAGSDHYRYCAPCALIPQDAGQPNDVLRLALSFGLCTCGAFLTMLLISASRTFFDVVNKDHIWPGHRNDSFATGPLPKRDVYSNGGPHLCKASLNPCKDAGISMSPARRR